MLLLFCIQLLQQFYSFILGKVIQTFYIIWATACIFIVLKLTQRPIQPFTYALVITWPALSCSHLTPFRHQLPNSSFSVNLFIFLPYALLMHVQHRPSLGPDPLGISIDHLLADAADRDRYFLWVIHRVSSAIICLSFFSSASFLAIRLFTVSAASRPCILHMSRS